MYSQQPQRIVIGKITDAETGEPVSSVAVFIAGTTSGTTTGNDGTYQLKLPGSGVYDLIVSHVGYEPVFHKIDIPRAFIRFDVSLKTHELEDILIIAERPKPHPADVILFWKTILGTAPSSTIYVTNPDVVNYLWEPEERRLTVSGRSPIEIVNMETGYKINFLLQSFTHDMDRRISSWTGQVFFEELTPRDDRQKRMWDFYRQTL